MSGYGASWYTHTLQVRGGLLVVVLPTTKRSTV